MNIIKNGEKFWKYTDNKMITRIIALDENKDAKQNSNASVKPLGRKLNEPGPIKN